MVESKVCRLCGSSLDDKVDYVFPNGAKQGRCPGCGRPYAIAGQEAEPELETESKVEPTEKPGAIEE